MSGKKKLGGRPTSTRRLTKTGSYTFYVTIPKEFIEELGWRERQNLVVKKSGDKIVIEDIKKAKKRAK